MIPVIDVSRIIGWGKTALADTIKWIALRTLLISLCVTLIPIAIYKGYLLILEQVFSLTNTNLSGFENSVVTFTELGAFLADALQIPACVSLLISAYSARFILSFIRK
jgi:hypothetical protein